MRTRYFFGSLLLTCLLIFGTSFAESCGCGCECPAPCECGCMESGVCGCHSTLEVQPQNDCCYNPCAERYWRQAHCIYQGPYSCIDCDSAFTICDGCYGTWLPEDPPLFRPFAADPRQVTYSVGWRFNDQAMGKNLIPVSFGDILPIYRFASVWPWWGMMEVSIEGALWAIFAPLKESAPLCNADYYVGIPIDYAIGRWAFRLRGYHISSHIGDEFLLDNPGFDRRNPSAEYLDLSASWYITDEIRLYAVGGWVIQHDQSFYQGNVYAEAGAELRLPRLGFYDPCQHLFGEPIFAMHFKYQDAFNRPLGATYILGYEWGKTSGAQHRLRAFFEYHDGQSVEGQFSEHRANYLALRLTYGY